MLLWRFFSAIAKHWYVLMGTAVFTMLGIYVAATQRSSQWVVWSSLSLAILLLLIAAYLTWRDQWLISSSLERDLKNERSAKQAPELLLTYEKNYMCDLSVKNLSDSRNAYDVALRDIDGPNFVIYSDTIPLLKSGGEALLPISRVRYINENPQPAEPIKIEDLFEPSSSTIPLLLTFKDSVGSVSYATRYSVIFKPVLDIPSIHKGETYVDDAEEK